MSLLHALDDLFWFTVSYETFPNAISLEYLIQEHHHYQFSQKFESEHISDFRVWSENLACKPTEKLNCSIEQIVQLNNLIYCLLHHCLNRKWTNGWTSGWVEKACIFGVFAGSTTQYTLWSVYVSTSVNSNSRLRFVEVSSDCSGSTCLIAHLNGLNLLHYCLWPHSCRRGIINFWPPNDEICAWNISYIEVSLHIRPVVSSRSVTEETGNSGGATRLPSKIWSTWHLMLSPKTQRACRQTDKRRPSLSRNLTGLSRDLSGHIKTECSRTLRQSFQYLFII